MERTGKGEGEKDEREEKERRKEKRREARARRNVREKKSSKLVCSAQQPAGGTKGE